MKDSTKPILLRIAAVVAGAIFLWWRYTMPSRHGFSAWQMVYAIILLLGVVVMAEIDIKTQQIPNPVLAYFLCLGMIRVATDPKNLISYGAAFLLMGGFLLLIAVISKGKLGGGDIKLMALAGLCLGLRDVFVALALASIFASIIGLLLLATKKIDRHTPIPFGPFLGAGIFLAYLFGWQIR